MTADPSSLSDPHRIQSAYTAKVKSRLATRALSATEAREALLDCFVATYFGAQRDGIDGLLGPAATPSRVRNTVAAFFRRRLPSHDGSFDVPTAESLDRVRWEADQQLAFNHLPAGNRAVHLHLCNQLMAKTLLVSPAIDTTPIDTAGADPLDPAAIEAPPNATQDPLDTPADSEPCSAPARANRVFPRPSRQGEALSFDRTLRFVDSTLAPLLTPQRGCSATAGHTETAAPLPCSPLAKGKTQQAEGSGNSAGACPLKKEGKPPFEEFRGPSEQPKVADAKGDEGAREGVIVGEKADAGFESTLLFIQSPLKEGEEGEQRQPLGIEEKASASAVPELTTPPSLADVPCSGVASTTERNVAEVPVAEVPVAEVPVEGAPENFESTLLFIQSPLSDAEKADLGVSPKTSSVASKAGTHLAPADPDETSTTDSRATSNSAKSNDAKPTSAEPTSADPTRSEPTSTAVSAHAPTQRSDLPPKPVQEEQHAQGSDSKAARYDYHQELGRGGMAVVYAAEDRTLGREVAIKRSLQPVGLREEARAMALLEHPNVPPVHELSVDAEGHEILTMKLVRGESLEDLIHRLRDGDPRTHAAYPLARRLDIFASLLAALGAAHRTGLVHRDVKPSNIMIGARGETLLMDWGIACNPQKVGPGITGTPAYMAPEQCAGEAADGRSDLYAAFVVLYELLTLTPYVEEAESALATVHRAATRTPPSIYDSAFVQRGQPPVPAEWRHFLRWGLRPNKETRPQTADEVADQLDAIRSGEIPINCPVTALKRGQVRLLRTIERFPRVALGLCGVGLFAAGALLWP